MAERISPEAHAAYQRIHATDEFAQLKRTYLRFVVPLTIAFMAWYLLYVLMSNYAGDFMDTKVVGNINVALIFGLLQFVSTFAIAICPQRWDGAERWGDTHFARALADELRRRGHRARIEVVADWDDPAREPADVTIHLRGLFAYVPRGDELNVLWNISHPDLVTVPEQDAFDLVLTPSARHAETLSARSPTPA